MTEKSTTLGDLAKALSKFQGEISAVKKEGKNPYFNSKYATLDSIIELIKKPLEKNGLAISQFPTGENELTTILMHTSGEYIMSTAKMYPKDNTPQGQGSAITYMRRYSVSAILGIATEEDDDGNAATKPANASKRPADARKHVAQAIEPDGEQVIEYGGAMDEMLDSMYPNTKEMPLAPAPPTPKELKVKIFQLCKMLKIEAKKDKIEKITALPMKDENLAEILTRLEAIYKENREAERELKNKK